MSILQSHLLRNLKSTEETHNAESLGNYKHFLFALFICVGSQKEKSQNRADVQG